MVNARGVESGRRRRSGESEACVQHEEQDGDEMEESEQDERRLADGCPRPSLPGLDEALG